MKTEILKYERIRDMRIDRGLTQKEVAKVINVKQNTYSQYEIGVLNYPLDVVIKLAEFYGTSVVNVRSFFGILRSTLTGL